MATVLSLILSILTINAEYTCPSSAPCNVDCSDVATDCTTTINASEATSLTVLCNEASSCDTILLPNTISQSSSITCSATSSCKDAEIYYLGDATSSPANNNIELICTLDDACYNTQVFADNAGNFKLDCDGVECVNLKINVQNVDNVNLQCKAAGSYYGACYGTTLGNFFVAAQNVTSTVNITCTGEDGCNKIKVNADRAASVSIYAAPLALQYGEFIATNVGTSFEITCIGNGSDAGCNYSPEFFVPTDLSKFTINCYGTGCKDIELTKIDGFSSIGNANINFNGCGQCDANPTKSSGCLNVLTRCYDTSTRTDYFPVSTRWYCGTSPYCNCDTVATAFKNAYVEDFSDPNCILPAGTISCGSNCDVDCSSQACAGNVIAATATSSLTVTCSTQDSCEGTVIYAPISSSSTANIICSGKEACGSSTTNTFILFAKNSYDVTITGHPEGLTGYYGPTIYAEKIQNSFTLTCIGNGTSKVGCDLMDLYVPDDLSKFTLNCYGTGCGGQIDLYSDSGLQAISNINWNGCLQCDASDPGARCLRNRIYTKCQEVGSYVSGSIYRDTECDETTVSKCGCDELGAAFANAFEDNTADSNCIVPPGTIQCTDACTIECSSESCAGNMIDGTQATSLIIRCNTVDSCTDTVIHPTIGASSSTTVICSSTDSRSRYESGCNGDFQILGNNAYDLTVTAMTFGFLGGEIYAQNIQNSFRLNCIGNGTGSSSSYKNYACDGIDVHIPALDADLSKFSMNCYGTGCGSIDFRKADGFANIGNADINFNGCLQCAETDYDEAYNCLGTIRTYCSGLTTSYDSFGTSSYGGYSCGTGTIYCSCDVLGSAFQSGYKDDTSDSNCILGGGAIICTANEDCVVDCSTASCAGNIIAASEATGLTVTCSTDNSCDGTSISLPVSITSTSTITCSAATACNDLKATFGGDASSNPTNHNINLVCNTVDESCKAVIINADKAGTISYTCDGIECYDVEILANNADTITISCEGARLTQTGDGCNYLTVNATDVSSVTLSSSGNDGISSTKIYANRATSVVLDLNGDSGSSNKFYANKAGLIDVTCYGGFDGTNQEYSGCDQAVFFVPDTITSSNFKLTCYGKGCNEMNLYSANGFKGVSSDNFVINGCSDCKLNEEDLDYGEDYCMSSLGLGCIDPTNDPDAFTTYNPDEYNGYDCGLTLKYDCGCSEAATVLNNAFSEDADSDNCESSLYESNWEEEEEDNSAVYKLYIIILVVLIIFGCCVAAGYARRFYMKQKWEQRKATKDQLKSQIDGGDATKQQEYDTICKDTPDEFEEPEMKHWSDYGLWYGVDPFFGLFVDRFDKYFVYIGWFGEAIDVFVTFWIIGQLLSPYAAFACCSYSQAGANCNPQQGMSEDLGLITTENGWCVVDGTPCVNKYYYDKEDPTALFECFGGDTPEINADWNDKICGENARKDAVAGNSAWIIVVLVFKLIKLGWDYYMQIVEFMEKKRVARENLKIVNEYKEKHPKWQPDDEKQPKMKSEGQTAGDIEMETKDDNDKEEEKAGDNDNDVVTDGPVFIDEQEIRVCGCIGGGLSTDNKYYLYCLMIMNFLGVTLALAVLGGLEASGGISIGECEYSYGDYDSACYNVGKCANPGTAASGSIDFSSGSDGDTYDEPVYAIINKNVDLEGPQILAIFAMLIGYIAYVPWIRGKINEIVIKKGWREGETEKDALEDQEMWTGLF